MEVRVEVKESRVHGMGLFAKEGGIQKGERICFYRGQNRDASVKVTMRKNGQDGTVGIKNAVEVFKSVTDSLETVDRCMAHPNPKRRSVRLGEMESRQGFGVGQFINDSTRPEFGELDFQRGLDALRKYQRDSLKGASCEVVPASDFWFEATRDIEAGEEIFAHYGFDFWLQKMMLESSDPRWRLLFYSLHDQRTRAFDLRKFYSYDEETCRAFLEVMIKYDIASSSSEVTPVAALCKMTEEIRLG